MDVLVVVGMTRSTSIAATSLLLALSTSAHADTDADAAAWFDKGDALMSAGKLGEACDAFEASNRIEPRAGTLIHLGECRTQNRQLASAWTAYKAALARVKDPKKKEIAIAKVGELESKLSYLTITVPEDHRLAALSVTRNGEQIDARGWNQAVPVDGGVYTIVVRAPGREPWTTRATVPDGLAKVNVDVPKLAVTGADVDELMPVEAPSHATHSVEVVVWTPRRKLATAVGGGAALVLVGGIVLGTQAKR